MITSITIQFDDGSTRVFKGDKEIYYAPNGQSGERVSTDAPIAVAPSEPVDAPESVAEPVDAPIEPVQETPVS